MPFLAEDPMKRNGQQARPNYIQGGQAPASQPGMGSKLLATAGGKATDMLMKGPLQTASNALLGTVEAAAIPAVEATATSLAIPAVEAVAGTGMLGALGGMGAMGAAAAPMLAAMGPMALLALPFLFKDGTSSVPEQNYGPDPFAGYNPGYNNGTMGVPSGANMAYAGGTDSVPAMLTPGEAVIPAAAAQNPANRPMIDSMVNEGREANQMAQGGPLQSPQQVMPDMDGDDSMMAGPLSGKTKREQMKLLQDMSLKKKTWEADEHRKQVAFDQKMEQNRQQAMLSMRQSQE